VIGAVFAFGAACVFAFIAWNALSDGPLVLLDKSIALHMKEADKEEGLFRAIVILITDSGGIAAMTILAVLGVLWEGWRGHGKWRVAVGWAVIVTGGAALNLGMKAALQRQRPPLEWRDPVVYETNESFPSGHAMGGAIGIGLLGYALMLRHRRWRTKLLIVLALGTWVMSIGFSRVYLRAHWFSDVLGGFALGLAWLSLGLGIVETWRRRHGQTRAH
jgi:undecaprenyl-diphosphatase